MLGVRLESDAGRRSSVLLQDMQAAPLPVLRRVARLQKRLGPKTLSHFMALAAVPYGFLALLRLFNVKDQLAGVAADQNQLLQYKKGSLLNVFAT